MPEYIATCSRCGHSEQGNSKWIPLSSVISAGRQCSECGAEVSIRPGILQKRTRLQIASLYPVLALTSTVLLALGVLQLRPIAQRARYFNECVQEVKALETGPDSTSLGAVSLCSGGQ